MIQEQGNPRRSTVFEHAGGDRIVYLQGKGVWFRGRDTSTVTEGRVKHVGSPTERPMELVSMTMR